MQLLPLTGSVARLIERGVVGASGAKFAGIQVYGISFEEGTSVRHT